MKASVLTLFLLFTTFTNCKIIVERISMPRFLLSLEELKSKLPFEKTDAQKERRKELFHEWESKYYRGALSLSQIETGIIYRLGLRDFLTRKDVLRAAFNAARRIKKTGKRNDNRIDFYEFRVLLQYIYEYSRYRQIFESFDADKNDKLSIDEIEAHSDVISKEIGGGFDFESEFKVMKQHWGGDVWFEDFVEYVVQKKSENED